MHDHFHHHTSTWLMSAAAVDRRSSLKPALRPLPAAPAGSAEPGCKLCGTAAGVAAGEGAPPTERASTCNVACAGGMCCGTARGRRRPKTAGSSTKSSAPIVKAADDVWPAKRKRPQAQVRHKSSALLEAVKRNKDVSDNAAADDGRPFTMCNGCWMVAESEFLNVATYTPEGNE